MNNASQLIALDELPDFAPFPTVATRALEACKSPNCEASEIAEIVQCDPSMTLQLVRLANSSAFGFGSSVSTVEQAIVVMGFRATQSHILAAAAATAFTTGGKAELEKTQLWQHSLGCAAVARLVANQVDACPNEAFLAAIVHDIGKLVFLDVAKDSYQHVVQDADSSRVTHIERETFGVTHTELGERYGYEWGLPGHVIDAIACHHDPGSAIGDNTLAGVICVANSIAISGGVGSATNPDEQVERALERSPISLDTRSIQFITQNAPTAYEAVRQACE